MGCREMEQLQNVLLASGLSLWYTLAHVVSGFTLEYSILPHAYCVMGSQGGVVRLLALQLCCPFIKGVTLLFEY